MSNALRNIGSSRSVDAAARTAPSTAGDANTGDGEFANVMNLAMNAASGMGATNGNGGDPDGALTGRAARREGEATTAASSGAQLGTAPANLQPNTSAVDSAIAGGDQSRQSPAPSERAPSDAVTIPDVHAPSALFSSDASLVTSPQHRGERQTRTDTNETGPIQVSISNPSLPAAAGLAHRSDRPAAPSRHRDEQRPRANADDANQLIATVVSPTLPAGPSNAGGNVDPPHGTINRITTLPPDGNVVGVAPAQSGHLDTRAGGHLFAAAPSDMADQSNAAPGRARFAAGMPDTAFAADTMPPSDSSADTTEASTGLPPAIPGRAASAAATISADSPPVTAIFRPNGTATVGRSTGQNGGSDQINDSAPDSGVNPAPVIPIDHRGGDNSAVPGQNSATIPSIIVGVAAQDMSGPAFPEPRLRQTNDNSAIVGASSAVIGTTPLNPLSAASGTAPGDSGLPGAIPQSFGDALANHVLSMAANGHQETTLQLQPPQLGDLTVRIAVQGRDVSAWFGAAQPQVQLAVSQALDQLRLDLTSAGFNLTGAWVGADASGAQRQFETTAVPARRSGFSAPSIERATESADLPQRSSGVSIYV